MNPIPKDPEELMTHLAEMATRACVGNPNLPCPMMGDCELELDLGENTATPREWEEEAHEPTPPDYPLEFEADRERTARQTRNPREQDPLCREP